MTESTSSSDLVLLTRPETGVAHLVLNRPAAMNALDLATARAFRKACEQLAGDREVRAVVLRGKGRGFGAGGDLASMREKPEVSVPELIGEMNVALGLLAHLDAPVIASLHGVVAGGSLSLSLACDLAIAAEGTRFTLAYANVGASPDVSGTWSLPRLVGLRKALELALLCEPFDAAEALRLGLVNRVVPAGALEEETAKLARRLADGPTVAFGQTRRLMRAAFETTLTAQLEGERQGFAACTRSEDFRAAVAAFLEKRKPVFQGR
ncbi:MAG TPA: enoyl-CoA hydratase-related protein [Ramlibacter sp.]|nr:enoyl-CoA hydratase-related protein [Ramlibacter sp.]